MHMKHYACCKYVNKSLYILQSQQNLLYLSYIKNVITFCDCKSNKHIYLNFATMSYYNELFIEHEDTNELVHVGSALGSDTPGYFDDVKSLKDWDDQLKELGQNNVFYPHSMISPFPWVAYKTSDHLIVLRKIKRMWFDFISAKYEVWVSIHNPNTFDEHTSYFVQAKHWLGDADYSEHKIIELQLPKRKSFDEIRKEYTQSTTTI